MSKFSNKCKDLLNENGSNVYQLSVNSSLERTTLQRMITGKRLPKVEFVKNFCSALRLSKSEEDELLELYKIEVMGEEAYRSEQSILNLLQHLKDLEDKESFPSPVDIGIISLKSNELPTRVSTQTHDTEFMMDFILIKEFSQEDTGTIYTNLPGNYEPFIHSLELFYRQFHKRISVQHLIHFQMNSSLSSENLDVMNQVLPLFMSNVLDYQVFYYYSRLTKNDEMHILFPYYIITSEHVLLLSDDYKKGILLSEPDLIRQYLQEFQKISSLSKPLFQRIQSIDKAWMSYQSDIIMSKPEIHYLHFQPCFLDLIEEETFYGLTRTYLPDFLPIAEGLLKSIKEKSTYPNFAFFSEEGLDEFFQAGKYYGQIGVFFPPSDVQQRIDALNYFSTEELYHNNYILRKDSRLSLPKHLYFELQGTHVLQIIRMESLEKMDFITIQESSICEAFYNFFHSLPTSKYVYSEEEAKNIISEKLSELTFTPPQSVRKFDFSGINLAPFFHLCH